MKLPKKGVLSRGYDADIVILDNQLKVKKVILKGEVV